MPIRQVNRLKSEQKVPSHRRETAHSVSLRLRSKRPAVRIARPPRRRLSSKSDQRSGKTLDGLFLMLGEEEKKIRKDPAAQATWLLKEVFGRK